jgi:arsenate reductase
MKVTIWHNPACGSSRAALDRLTSKGVKPEIYLYMTEKPSKARIREVLKQLRMKPAGLLRAKEAAEFGLSEGDSDEAILQAMVSDPRLIQRPVVISPKGAVLARPPLRVDEIL